MAFEDLLAKMPTQSVTRYQGVVVSAASGTINVNGNVLPCRFLDPVIVADGDPVAVDLMSSATGQYEAVVVGRLSSTIRPSEATVKTTGSPTITVQGIPDGVTYTAKYNSAYTPVVNDRVNLKWDGPMPYVIGKTGAAVNPPKAAGVIDPPPSDPTEGIYDYPASDSASFNPSTGLWDVSMDGSGHVYQGTPPSGGALYGAWFYGGAVAQISDFVIYQIELVLGNRRPVGPLAEEQATLHLYTHSSSDRPDGDVTRVDGPYDITVQPWSTDTVVPLPLSFAATLQAGGGIAIAGDPFVGFEGRRTDPVSGTLRIYWKRVS